MQQYYDRIALYSSLADTKISLVVVLLLSKRETTSLDAIHSSINSP